MIQDPIYNAVLVGKLLDLAGHPGTPDTERLVAVRKANEHCTSKGHTLGDVAKFVTGDMFIAAVAVPSHGLQSIIADLRMEKISADGRIAAQSDAIADLKRAKAADTAKIVSLQDTVAELQARCEALVRERDEMAATKNVGVEAIIEPIVTATISAPMSDKRRGDKIGDTVEHRATARTRKAASVLTDMPEIAPQRKKAIQSRFRLLAWLGNSKATIARTMTREFGRIFTTAMVGAMMRERWLSPTYLGAAA